MDLFITEPFIISANTSFGGGDFDQAIGTWQLDVGSLLYLSLLYSSCKLSNL
jgi:hypothetical protein